MRQQYLSIARQFKNTPPTTESTEQGENIPHSNAAPPIASPIPTTSTPRKQCEKSEESEITPVWVEIPADKPVGAGVYRYSEGTGKHYQRVQHNPH